MKALSYYKVLSFEFGKKVGRENAAVSPVPSTTAKVLLSSAPAILKSIPNVFQPHAVRVRAAVQQRCLLVD